MNGYCGSSFVMDCLLIPYVLWWALGGDNMVRGLVKGGEARVADEARRTSRGSNPIFPPLLRGHKTRIT